MILLLAVFLAGLFLALYPRLRGAAVDRQLQKEAEQFLEWAASAPTAPKTTVPVTAPPDETHPIPETAPAENRPYQQLWEDMTAYNRAIYETGQSELTDESAYEIPSFTLTDYGLDSEIFGVISIPKLEIEMPIYLGASCQHMVDGAAHLSQTSLPIGGENTNCVLAGHRGWRGAEYFLHITELEVGDAVQVTNLWEILRYRVTEIRVIEPNDIQAILIQDGRELLTLLTCHQPASGGKLRYLVFCEPTDKEET